jgi:hypothetical protein
MWLFVGNYLVAAWFDPMQINDANLDFFAFLAGLATVVLVFQLVYNKIADSIGNFHKHFEIKKRT